MPTSRVQLDTKWDAELNGALYDIVQRPRFNARQLFS